MDGHFVVVTTADGGKTWLRQAGPPSLSGEGAFAASGTCLITRGRNEAWFGTGGPGGARVFHSRDGGRTWSAAQTPVRNDAASAGIFSLAFSDALHGIAAGGDYAKPSESRHNIAVTTDGGRTWVEPAGAHPGGYRSAVVFVPKRKMWAAVGTTGSDISYDGGTSWQQFDHGAFNAVSFSGTGFAAGPDGRIAVFQWAAGTPP